MNSSRQARMKRKLDTNDVPVPILESQDGNDVHDVAEKHIESAKDTFTTLGLDSRLLQGIVKQKFEIPTPVQMMAIPFLLQGKDVLVRAKTGSGKTAAYLLPILHSVLKRKESSATALSSISALILVPTRELAEQIQKAVETFSSFCAKDIRAANLAPHFSDAVQRSLLANLPDIVIATPAKASSNVNSSALLLGDLKHLVIDEADLVLSYGYDDDIKNVAERIPKGVQKILMSATLTDEVDTLKGLFCRDPVVLKLEEKDDEGQGVQQYVVKCGEDEKFLLIYVIFKLKLIKGKCIVFVGDIDRCYRLKLYLEQFGVKSCILNSELPVNSRIHVVEEFNKNVYDIIVASDEHEILGDDMDQEVPEEELKENKNIPKGRERNGLETESKPSLKKKRKGPKRDREYGISRGIDFKNVACVLNFDLPTSSKSYTHRIGRTARAGQSGMALSFVIPAHLFRKHIPTSHPTCEHDETVLAKITKSQSKRGKEVNPYNFDMKQVEAFRYRMGDALRAVTKVAIREARTRELREELIKSEKLKRHFEENPGDLKHLRHDSELRPAKVQPHMRHVPDYLMPGGGTKALTAGNHLGFVGLRKTSENRIRKARAAKSSRGKGRKVLGKKINPLKTFRTGGMSK